MVTGVQTCALPIYGAEEDFEDTIDVVKKAKFDSAYTFIYSKRTGTPAAVMENQVSQSDMTRRFDKLLSVVQETGAKRTARFTGRTMPVLVEERNSHDASMVTGRLENNIVVHFAGDESLIGSIVNVTLTECKGFYYIGRINDV